MARHARFDPSSLSLTGIEHLLQPPEAPVWACAALVWCLHHRHWFGPLLQVGSLKYCTRTASTLLLKSAADQCASVHPCPSFGWLSTFYAINLLSSVGLTDCPLSHLFVLAQKENHVPKHCKCHRANGRWEGCHRLHLQQRHQEGNRHVCNVLQQKINSVQFTLKYIFANHQ